MAERFIPTPVEVVQDSLQQEEVFPHDPLPTSGTIFRGPRMKDNQIRHAENISIFHGGFYHGVYYDRGRAQQPKNKKNGTI